jgi:hypothetical protein
VGPDDEDEFGVGDFESDEDDDGVGGGAQDEDEWLNGGVPASPAGMDVEMVSISLHALNLISLIFLHAELIYQLTFGIRNIHTIRTAYSMAPNSSTELVNLERNAHIRKRRSDSSGKAKTFVCSFLSFLDISSLLHFI